MPSHKKDASTSKPKPAWTSKPEPSKNHTKMFIDQLSPRQDPEKQEEAKMAKQSMASVEQELADSNVQLEPVLLS